MNGHPSYKATFSLNFIRGDYCSHEFYFSGFMGTNTSMEMEAYHQALQEAGLSATLKNGESQPFDSSYHGNKSNTSLVQKILSEEPKSGMYHTRF
jgi:hypothetical protein